MITHRAFTGLDSNPLNLTPWTGPRSNALTDVQPSIRVSLPWGVFSDSRQGLEPFQNPIHPSPFATRLSSTDDRCTLPPRTKVHSQRPKYNISSSEDLRTPATPGLNADGSTIQSSVPTSPSTTAGSTPTPVDCLSPLKPSPSSSTLDGTRAGARRTDHWEDIEPEDDDERSRADGARWVWEGSRLLNVLMVRLLGLQSSCRC